MTQLDISEVHDQPELPEQALANGSHTPSESPSHPAPEVTDSISQEPHIQEPNASHVANVSPEEGVSPTQLAQPATPAAPRRPDAAMTASMAAVWPLKRINWPPHSESEVLIVMQARNGPCSLIVRSFGISFCDFSDLTPPGFMSVFSG